MKRKFYVFMALLSGLICSLSIYYYLNNIQTTVTTELKPLVVAGGPMQARTIIKEDLLALKQVPADSFPQGGASSIEEIRGKVLLVGLEAGDIILDPMLEESYNIDSPLENKDNLSLTVPEGKRAVAIPVSSISSVGFQIEPGDRVDILVTMEINENNESKLVTALAAQDVLVLNVGTNQGKETAPGYHILAMNVSQAMAVTLGSEKGSLRLLLRNPANQELYRELPVEPSIFLKPEYFSHFK